MSEIKTVEGLQEVKNVETSPKYLSLNVTGENNKKFQLIYEEGSSIIELEKVAYRLLQEFIVINWRNNLIAQSAKTEDKKVENSEIKK